MCLGQRPRQVVVEQPEPIKPPPMLATPPPPKPTPPPEKVEKADAGEGQDLIRSKKKTAKKIEQLKAGVKEFSAISGDVPDTPDQGINTPLG